MKHEDTNKYASELKELCSSVRSFVIDGDYETCIEPICLAMERFPHAPQPHNLLGIVMEKLGDHHSAMKHFRVAWALDPTYLPANHNLNTYGTFFSKGNCAFDESDLPSDRVSSMEVEYDKCGIGRVVHKSKIVYDTYGVGKVIRR